MSTAIANQLFLAYLGRPADSAWRTSTANLLNGNQPSAALQTAFYNSAISEGVFSATDSTSTLVNKIFLQTFGFGATTFEQTAWSNLVSNGTITKETLGWTIFSSYLGATNVPAAYQTPAQSKLIAIDAYTNQLSNDSSANLALSQGGAAATLARSYASGVTTQATAATAVSGVNASVASLTTSQTGTTFTLTTGVDNLTGTTNNDTFSADNTGASKQLSVADGINGGAGTDTLKVYLAAADLAVPGATLTSVENLYINGGGIQSADFSTSAFSGVTGISIDSAIIHDAAANGAAAAGAVTYTVKGQTVSQANSVASDSANTVIAGTNTTTIASATDTVENITLNNYTSVKAGTTAGITATQTLDIAGTLVKTVNITGTGAASKFILSDTGNAVTAVTVTGSVAQTITLTGGLDGLIKTFDASTATGKIALDISTALTPAAFTFTGGTAADTLTLRAAEFGTLTSGAQLDGGAGIDTIVIKDTTPNYTGLNAIKNFEIVQLGVTGTTIDMSQVSSLKEVAVTTGTETINGLGTGSIVDINGATTSVTLAGALGTTAATVNLGTATGAGFTTTALVTSALTSLSVKVAGTSAQTITTLTNADNSAITITGSTALTVTNALVGVAVGDKVDASAFTAKLTLIGSASADIITVGSGGSNITGGGGADQITLGAGTDTVVYTTLADSLATNAATTNDTITNFTAGTDKIDVTNLPTAVQQGALFAANGTGNLATDIGTAIANGTAAFAIDNAAVVTINGGTTAGTYLVINDHANAGYAAADDAVIKLVGLTGTLAVADFV